MITVSYSVSYLAFTITAKADRKPPVHAKRLFLYSSPVPNFFIIWRQNGVHRCILWCSKCTTCFKSSSSLSSEHIIGSGPLHFPLFLMNYGFFDPLPFRPIPVFSGAKSSKLRGRISQGRKRQDPNEPGSEWSKARGRKS